MSNPPPLAPPPLAPVSGQTNTNKRSFQQNVSNNSQLQPPTKRPRTAAYPASYPTPYQHPQHQAAAAHYQYNRGGYQHYQHPQNHRYQAQYAQHQQYQQQQHQQHQQYNTRGNESGTTQYYDKKRIQSNKNYQPQKSVTPPIQTVSLSQNNNKLPSPLISKLQNNEEKINKSNPNKNDKNNNNNNIKAMIYIGDCFGVLFGPQHNKSDAQTGPIKFRHKQEKQAHMIQVYTDSTNSYLGQIDMKVVKVFAELYSSNKVRLKGEIIDDDQELKVLKKRLPPNRFARRVKISVSSHYDVIPQVVLRCRRKCKSWKWKKESKSVILDYFEGKEVEYRKLEEHIIKYINEHKTYSGSVMQLEANFNRAFEKDITADDLDGIDANEEIVKTKLLQHQRVGLQWMIIRENFEGEEDDELPPFYKEIEDADGNIKYLNIISDEEIADLPELGCGGILADDMGLGKTLQCISLIASNSGFNSVDNIMGDGPTLIIAPLTVIGNWYGQIADHCNPNSFKIMIYHGPNREKNLDIIQQHNVVITTFDIVALEYCDETDENREEMRKHYGCGLQYINWLRVVLDEAHKIRSRKTRIFKACNALQAKSRWCLTGTPVQNRLDDLYSLFRFLKLQPICEQSFWTKFIIQPLKNGQNIGFERLRKVMKQLCLRRNKDMKIGGKRIINIPDKIVQTRKLEFSTEERLYYDQLMSMHKAQFNRLRQNGDKEIMRNFSSVLSMLLRLRQCCAHTDLIPNINEKSSLSDLSLSELTDNNQECASCGMSPDTPVLTTCNHVYCKDCFLYECEVNPNGFPCLLCGDHLNDKSIKEEIKVREAEEAEVEEEEKNDDDDEDGDGKKKKKRKKYKKFKVKEGRIEPSTKMRTLINDVHSWENQEVGGSPQKAVVFSQWTSVLDILAKCLDQEDIIYERLDGSMSRAMRENAMENFRKDEFIPVFLMSLKAGNLGVNMTVANHVYMLDPWWNPATEDQAVDRVYRLGQKRKVHINHFVIKNSVEEKILNIQKRKRTLISQALGTSKQSEKNGRKSEWLNDLKDLFSSR